MNIFDLVVVGQHFGQTITAPLELNLDVNGDSIVNIFDMVLISSHFGEVISENPPVAP